MEIIAQVIGLLAVVTFLLSYQLKKRSNIILFNVISRLLYILQYLLLGAFSGATLDILATFSSLIADKNQAVFKRKLKVPIVVLVNLGFIITGGILIFYNQSLFDAFAVLGVMFEINSFWFKKEKTIRMFSLCGAPFWFTYNILNHAYGSAIGNILTVISIVVALIRYRKIDN